MIYKKVAIYLRKSRLDGTEESIEETLARHERMLLDFCKRNNLIVVKTYKEVVTGDSIEVRPEMQQLLEDVEDGLYDGVVVIELERLSRGNPMDQYIVADTFKKSNTLIYTLTKNYNLASDNEFDEEFFEFGLFMSRREYKTIKRRLLRGRLQAQKEGYFIGSVPPYGFNKEKQGKGFVLVPNQDAEIVKLIFEKYVYDELSCDEIAKYLNSQGIKSLTNKLWYSNLVRRLLSNKVYLGYNNLNVNIKLKKDEKEHLPARHEAIIDENTFNLAQERLKIRSNRTKYEFKLRNPLASLLFCSACHKPLLLSHKSDHLRCQTVGCKNKGAYLHIVENLIIKELHNELDNFNCFLDNYGEEIKKQKLSKEKEIKLIEKEITKKENMINRCCEMLEEGIYTKEKYLDRVNILEADLNALKLNLDKIKATSFDEAEKVRTAIPKLKNVLDEYWNLDVEAKNLLLKSIIDKIEYTKTSRKKINTDDTCSVKILLKI